jgi:2-polyprenyl-3-methyl-5-hydroxy-6-metoxy-1,4-benzoquinol methylase
VSATCAEAIVEWVKGPRVLDVGCTGHEVEAGSPYWLHGRLRERFANVMGIDISEENVRALREMGFVGVHVASAEDFELPERFETIVAGEVIEHLSNPGRFLEAARKHLEDGGRLVLTTPNPFSLLDGLYALFKYPKTCQNAQRSLWLCPRTLDELAGRAGLRVAHFELIEDYRPDDPSWRYRWFVRLVRLLRPLIPLRLRGNAMLVVLAPNAGTR